MKRSFLTSSIEMMAAFLTHPFGAVLLVLALISLAPVVASTAGIELSRDKTGAMCDVDAAPAARPTP